MVTVVFLLKIQRNLKNKAEKHLHTCISIPKFLNTQFQFLKRNFLK